MMHLFFIAGAIPLPFKKEPGAKPGGSLFLERIITFFRSSWSFKIYADFDNFVFFEFQCHKDIFL